MPPLILAKRIVFAIAILALFVAIGGWIAWSSIASRGPGDDWTGWHNSIELIWRVIPSALVLAIVAGACAALIPPRKRSLVIAAVLIIALTLLVGGWFSYVLTHLGIR
jgi:hypothetical protein